MASCKVGGDAIEALRDTLGDGFELSGTGGLRRRNRLQVAAQFVHLGFESRTLLAFLRTLQHKPEHQDRHENHDSNRDCAHSFSNSPTGNGLLTLLALEVF